MWSKGIEHDVIDYILYIINMLLCYNCNKQHPYYSCLINKLYRLSFNEHFIIFSVLLQIHSSCYFNICIYVLIFVPTVGLFIWFYIIIYRLYVDLWPLCVWPLTSVSLCLYRNSISSVMKWLWSISTLLSLSRRLFILLFLTQWWCCTLSDRRRRKR